MTKATIESQLGLPTAGPAEEVRDTEEMFWLRRNDDFQSQKELGALLSAQYRFREAAAVWEEAMAVFGNDAALWLRIGGAKLTVRDFDGASKAFETYRSLLGREEPLRYPLGVWYYLKGDYRTAETWFERILPCDGEMTVAAVYWHSLCCLREEREMSLLPVGLTVRDVGHHTAYLRALEVLAGRRDAEETARSLGQSGSDLDECIVAFALACLYRSEEKEEKGLLDAVLEREEAWPCVPYLAAWNDRYGKITGEKHG
ncbi:MAG: hypothetical protein II797_02025 [Clostridia bacterium]|nr:hypothetical protein [Clostridia bacterium]